MSGQPDWRLAFDRDGFVVRRGLLPTDLISSAQSWLTEAYPTASTVLPEDEAPLLVMWRHVKGGAKRYALLDDCAAFMAIVQSPAVLETAKALCGGSVRLIEAVIFDKPPGLGEPLAWHQDLAFYPFSGGKLVSALVPLDPMSEDNGGLSLEVGSHLKPLSSAVDLHTGQRSKGDDREAPQDPAKLGAKFETPAFALGDVVFFDCLTLHGSGPNRSDQPRRILSLRFASLDMIYSPRPGNSASFVHQIKSAIGEPLSGGAFPVFE